MPAAEVESETGLPRPVWTRPFVFLLAGTFFQGTAFYCLLPALPLFVAGPLAGSKQAVGLAVGVFSLTAVLVRPFGGYLLDRFGRRPWMLAAAGLFTICTFGYLGVASFAWLVALRLVHGLGWGLVGVAGATVAADLVPDARRGEGLGAYGLAMPLALALGPLVGGVVLGTDRFGLLFACAAGLGVVAWVMFALVRCPPVRDPDARPRLGRMIERRVMPLFCLWLLPCLGYGGLVAFIPQYAARAGFDSAGPLFAVYALGALSVRWLAGRWYDRSGPGPVMLAGLGLATLGWLAIGLFTTKAGLVVGGLVLGMGFGVAVPAFQTMTVDLVEPARRGAANATTFSAYDIGVALGAIGAGWLAAEVSLEAIFILAGGLTALAMGLFLLWIGPYFRRHRLR